MLLAIVTLIAAANPARLALSYRPTGGSRRERRLVEVVGALLALAVLTALAAVSETLLEALDISPASFRIGAGGVIVLAGARWLVAGPLVWDDAPAGRRAALVPLLFPLLLAPELVVAALSFGADEGVPAVIAGTVLGLGAALAVSAASAPAPPGALVRAGGRLAGAAAIPLGVGLIVSGILAI